MFFWPTKVKETFIKIKRLVFWVDNNLPLLLCFLLIYENRNWSGYPVFGELKQLPLIHDGLIFVLKSLK